MNTTQRHNGICSSQICECGQIIQIEEPSDIDWTPDFATDDGIVMCGACYRLLPLSRRLACCRHNNMSIFSARRTQIPPNDYTSTDLANSRQWHIITPHVPDGWCDYCHKWITD